VRTDPDVAKHKGISTLIIPTSSPGITRRPFGSICGPDDLDFCEVFFDDVYVPQQYLVGGLNHGWKVATGALGEERAMLWLSQYELLDDLSDHFAERIRGTAIADDPIIHDWFGRLLIDKTALRLLGYRTVAKTARGKDPAEQSILKLFGSEAGQQAFMRALEALGPEGLDRETASAPYNHMHHEHFNASWFYRYCRSFANTIAGGTSEIQRNIVAERVLGLPR
jgi:alkylation response protein AidB-like acyl-CoA dehydrogenase